MRTLGETAGTATLETESETVRFEVGDVTATREVEAEFQASTPTSAVTRALAARMLLPTGLSYALRHDRTSAFLEEDQPIGSQVQAGERVTVTPRAHLGFAPGCRVR